MNFKWEHRVSLNRIMGQVDSVRAYELAIRAWNEYSHQGRFQGVVIWVLSRLIHVFLPINRK